MGHDPSLIEESVSFQFSLEVFGQLSVELHFWCTLLMFLCTLGSFFFLSSVVFKKFYLFTYLFLALPGLLCCAWTFSSGGKQKLPASCSSACWIFQDQGLNLCPLHWQVDF